MAHTSSLVDHHRCNCAHDTKLVRDGLVSSVWDATIRILFGLGILSISVWIMLVLDRPPAGASTEWIYWMRYGRTMGLVWGAIELLIGCLSFGSGMRALGAWKRLIAVRDTPAEHDDGFARRRRPTTSSVQ